MASGVVRVSDVSEVLAADASKGPVEEGTITRAGGPVLTRSESSGVLFDRLKKEPGRPSSRVITTEGAECPGQVRRGTGGLTTSGVSATGGSC